jgi:ATP-dependent Clp protease ATP-binding subunit ClpA
MRFSESACQALEAANREAQRLHHEAVNTGHLLLSLLQDATCAATGLLRDVGADTSRLRQSLESQLPEAATEEMVRSIPLPAGFTIDEKRIEELVRAGKVVRLPHDPGRLPQTDAVKRCIERAIEESRKTGPSRELLPGGAGAADVGTEHLLLGLLLRGGEVAGKVLGPAGVDAIKVGNRVART